MYPLVRPARLWSPALPLQKNQVATDRGMIVDFKASSFSVWLVNEYMLPTIKIDPLRFFVRR